MAIEATEEQLQEEQRAPSLWKSVGNWLRQTFDNSNNTYRGSQHRREADAQLAASARQTVNDVQEAVRSAPQRYSDAFDRGFDRFGEQVDRWEQRSNEAVDRAGAAGERIGYKGAEAVVNLVNRADQKVTQIRDGVIDAWDGAGKKISDIAANVQASTKSAVQKVDAVAVSFGNKAFDTYKSFEDGLANRWSNLKQSYAEVKQMGQNAIGKVKETATRVSENVQDGVAGLKNRAQVVGLQAKNLVDRTGKREVGENFYDHQEKKAASAARREERTEQIAKLREDRANIGENREQSRAENQATKLGYNELTPEQIKAARDAVAAVAAGAATKAAAPTTPAPNQGHDHLFADAPSANTQTPPVSPSAPTSPAPAASAPAPADNLAAPSAASPAPAAAPAPAKPASSPLTASAAAPESAPALSASAASHSNYDSFFETSAPQSSTSRAPVGNANALRGDDLVLAMLADTQEVKGAAAKAQASAGTEATEAMQTTGKKQQVAAALEV